MTRFAERSHIFIVGPSRSGTTMMSQVMGRHPDVRGFHEFHFFERHCPSGQDGPPLPRAKAERLAANLLASNGHDFRLAKAHEHEYTDQATELVSGLAEPTPLAIYAAVIEHVLAQDHKTLACKQTPQNMYYLRSILGLFPNARVVFMVRDPRAVLFSQKYKWRRRRYGCNVPWTDALRSWANYHPLVMARLWVAALRSVDFLRGDPRLLMVRFEDFTARPEAELERIGAFLGLDCPADMLAIPHGGSSHCKDETVQGIAASALTSWQGMLPRVDVALCQRMAQQDMERLGYAAEPVRAGLVPLLLSLLVALPLKGALALVLNLRRHRHLPGAIRRRLWGRT